MHKPVAHLMQFVLDNADGLPLAKRSQLYRDLAEVAPTPEDCKRLQVLAAECDAIDAAHQQLCFDFQQRARKTASPFGK